MHAEILAIGTELTTGAKLDTNSQWLSVELSAVGISVRYHVTVADDLDANLAVVRQAVERSDLVLITGGLGPTLDDLTRDVLAKIVDKPLVLHEPSLAIVKEMFARRNRPMPERNVVQAMFPEGSTVLTNPRGTAPGILVEVPRAGRSPSLVFAMPGVPSEMKPMFQNEVLPRLSAFTGGRVIKQARIHCFGLGESAFEELLGDVTARGRNPEVGITAHEATITLRIVADGSSAGECDAQIAATRAIIEQRLGRYIFGDEEDELQHAVVRQLASHNQTLAVVESATAGLIGRWLSDVAGSECCIVGALTAIPESSKSRLLEISPDQLQPAASAAAARNLAEHCREKFDSDYALAVTDVAPRDPADSQSPPIAFVALAGPSAVHAFEINLSGDPAILRSRAAKTALDLVRRSVR